MSVVRGGSRIIRRRGHAHEARVKFLRPRPLNRRLSLADAWKVELAKHFMRQNASSQSC